MEIFRRMSLFFLLFLLIASMCATVSGKDPADGHIELVFSTEGCEFTYNAELGLLDMETFVSRGFDGEPILPNKTYEIALPAEADIDTVTLTVLSSQSCTLDGTFGIDYGPYAATGTGDEYIHFGKNTEIYSSNALFPHTCISLQRTFQSYDRKVAIVSYTPFLYNPVSGELVLHTSVEIRLSWKKAPLSNSQKYLTSEEPRNGYAIVTTEAIVENSTNLGTFIENLHTRGYQVSVATEKDYGYEEGQARAENIRSWLQENVSDMRLMYLLLIGNPDPQDISDPSDTFGDVPMMMCWPCFNESLYRECPTDYFYADLTGDWDSNGNGYFGEYNWEYNGNYYGDKYDLGPELYVGRIPVYDADYASLDGILEKYIQYDGTNRSAMVPVAISNYENEDNNANLPRVDGRNLPQRVIENILAPNGYDSCVMYEREGIDPVEDTAFGYDAPLTRENVLEQWDNDYGIVLWWGHGMYFATYRKIWTYDDGDCIPENYSSPYEMSWMPFFTTSDNVRDSDTFVVCISCLNGTPEEPGNLGYALLKQGAVCTLSASRVSWYAVQTWDTWGTCDNVGVGYAYVDRLVNNSESAGMALYEAKNSCIECWQDKGLMNLFDFNLYGDPSLYLKSSASVAPTISVSRNVFTTNAVVEVQMNVCNSGQADANEVCPSLDISGDGTLVLANGPESAIIEGLSSETFVWTFIAAGDGDVQISGNVECKDADSGLMLSSDCDRPLHVTINPGTVVSPASIISQNAQNMANETYGTILHMLPDTLTEEMQELLDASQKHMQNATVMANGIYCNGELLKAYSSMQELEKLLI